MCFFLSAVGGGDVKEATVDVESADNMATLPVSRVDNGSTDTPEKNNADNKEMELKNVMPKLLERAFISSVYAMLLIFVCVAYVISDTATHRSPFLYSEGFFTYLYVASILFLRYLQGSSRRGGPSSTHSDAFGRILLQATIIIFGAITSFHVGAEFLLFFEIPPDSPCHLILRCVNSVLQMIFTFMQMYFIFMNERLKIHRKALVRFGLMHICATNICVGIRRVILEWMKVLTCQSPLQHSASHLNDSSNTTTPSPATTTALPATLVASAAPGWNIACNCLNILGPGSKSEHPVFYEAATAYALVGAVVIYVMWKNIDRYARNSEKRLVRRSKFPWLECNPCEHIDCNGIWKGVFFGSLVSFCSMITFNKSFYLSQSVKEEEQLLAIYLFEGLHCAILVLSILAILIGFSSVSELKLRCEKQGNFNDTLLLISAFGEFVYSAFIIIASINSLESEPNLLVCVTSLVAVPQVILQLLFITEVSRRRVNSPEHDRTKPTRQVVTFLYFINLTTFSASSFKRVDMVFNILVERDFFGYVAWTLIQRVTLSLSLFYHLYSSLTLMTINLTTYTACTESVYKYESQHRTVSRKQNSNR